MRRPRLFLLALLAITVQSCKKPDAAPPNIVYILADDLGYGDPGCYGQELLRTPNIDRIAREGMMFTRHYAGSTVCAPSRSSLMTGQHTGHTFIRGNKHVDPEGQYPLEASAVTLAEVLKQAGYVTGAFGKWGLGPVGSEGDPLSQGFDEFYGYNSQTLAHNYYPRHLWHNEEKVVLESNRDTLRGSYAPFLIQDQALAFINRHKDRPFFCYIPTTIPHAELAAPEASIKEYRDKFLPEKSYAGCDPGCPRYRKGGYASQTECHAAFAAMIGILDEQVGQVLDTLEKLGLADNTLVIFTSDNGPHVEGGADPDYFDSNGPYRGYKRDLYEGGIRVPMLVRWPGKVAAGSHTGHMSAFWDVLPTLAEIAGAGVPDNIDGISFLPTLLGQEGQRQHDYLYWEFYEMGGRRALEEDRWKVIQYGLKDDPKGPLMLFDIPADPSEAHDLASEHPDVVNRMKTLMDDAHTESGIFDYR